MEKDQATLLQQWANAKLALQQCEAVERDLRLKVASLFFGEQGDGSLTLDVGNGWKLRNVTTTSYKLDNTPEMLALVERFKGYSETAIAGQKLLRPSKPELSTTGYKLLPLWSRAMFDKFVTTKPQLPQLSLIPPTGK